MKFIRAYNNNRKIWIDDWNYDRIRFINWGDYGKQILARVNGKTIALARYIKNIEDPNFVVDHADGNHRNNLDSNLRVCSQEENTRNRKPNLYSNKSTKGTSWHIRRKKWIASIRVDGSLIHLGSFDTEEEAARAYDKAALHYFKEYARLNFPCQQSSVTRISTG